MDLLNTSFGSLIQTHVSTMTIFVKFDTDKTINIKRDVTEVFQNPDKSQWNSLWKDSKYSYNVRIPGARRTRNSNYISFQNSISLLISSSKLTKNKMCMKLFRNGGMQVTGCTSEDMASEVALDIGRVFLGRDVHIKSLTINMINIVCNIKKIIGANRHLDLDRLSKVILPKCNITSTYDRDKYFGLNAKIPLSNQAIAKRQSVKNQKLCNPQATILVFSSGIFVITGVKCPQHIETVRTTFVNALEMNLADVVLE